MSAKPLVWVQVALGVPVVRVEVSDLAAAVGLPLPAEARHRGRIAAAVVEQSPPRAATGMVK